MSEFQIYVQTYLLIVLSPYLHSGTDMLVFKYFFMIPGMVLYVKYYRYVNIVENDA